MRFFIRRSGALACVVGFLLLAPSTGAQAAPVVDQSFTEPSNLGARFIGPSYMAQTFTAGLTGRLTAVNVNIPFANPEGYGQLHVAIRTVDGAAPGATVLGDVLVDSRSVPLSRLVSFPQDIRVTAGTRYAIVVDQVPKPSEFDATWLGAVGDLYSGGAMFRSRDGGVTWAPELDQDLNFRTYVEPVPTSKDECKNGGWRSFGAFKNQGDCVSFVNAGKRA
jgi:hypothetical protein